MSWSTFREFGNPGPSGPRMPAHPCPTCGKKRVLIVRRLPAEVACRECVAKGEGVGLCVGAVVRYTGSDYSDLFFGPGIVTKVSGGYAWVRPTVGGDLRAAGFPSGHVVKTTDGPKIYGIAKLEVMPNPA